jgi:hypothetical protein
LMGIGRHTCQHCDFAFYRVERGLVDFDFCHRCCCCCCCCCRSSWNPVRGYVLCVVAKRGFSLDRRETSRYCEGTARQETPERYKG